MKKYFTFYILTLGLIFMFSSLIYAFYTFTSETSNLVIETANLDFEINQNDFDVGFIDKELIVPGDELINSPNVVNIVNKSTISSCLRLIIRIKIDDITYYLSDVDNEIIGVMSNGWTYDTTDECWYYLGVNGSISPPTDIDNPTKINILESLRINGNYFGNSIASKNVEVTIIFQAKQHDFVSWQNIGELNKNLGN